jgi:hypothetical protein
MGNEIGYVLRSDEERERDRREESRIVDIE